VLASRDGLATALAGCDAAIEAADGWGSSTAAAAAYSLRSSVARGLGRLTVAERDSQAAADLYAAAGADPRGDAAVMLLARRIAVRVDAGDVAGADALLAGFNLLARFDGDPPDGPGAVALRYSRGRLHAAAGRPGEALADLFRCGERLAACQTDLPTVLPWRSAAAVILAATGTPEAAARLVAAEVELNRRSGTASALGRSLRVQGVVLPGPPGLAALEEAVRLLDGSPRRFEYAQALVGLGLRLNEVRRRPQARRVLREAMELALRCGSPGLIGRARIGYAAAGGKLRPRD
jgi:tetratricopeptide (TPR) repeat protein